MPIQLTASQTFQLGNDTLTGALDLQLYDLTIVSAGVLKTAMITGPISGTGGITTTPIFLAVVISGGGTYSGTITANSYLVINGALPNSTVIMGGSCGYFGGSGAVGPLSGTFTWSGFAPGLGLPHNFADIEEDLSGPGILSTGSLALGSSVKFKVDLNGASAGTGYDQLHVTGTVTLTNPQLKVRIGSPFVPTVGQIYTVVDNDGADPVVGTFNGLPEGSSVNLNGTQFRISYVGGTGNDVTLTSTVVAKTWTGAVNGLWSNPGNWVGGVPVPGDPLIFPSATRHWPGLCLSPGVRPETGQGRAHE